jgi:hypothetical protein
MAYRFHAAPTWALGAAAGAADDRLTPDIAHEELIGEVLSQVEYRGESADGRARRLVGDGGEPAIYARSPVDLPALLRTADQLLAQARATNGDRPRLGQCRCGAAYAVPVILVPPATLRCDRCGAVIELDPARGPAMDDRTRRLNATRHALASFFREAMARGWPVLVTRA